MSLTYRIIQQDREFEQIFDFMKEQGLAKTLLNNLATPTMSQKPSYNILVNNNGETSLFHALVGSEQQLKDAMKEAGFVEDNNLTVGEQP